MCVVAEQVAQDQKATMGTVVKSQKAFFKAVIVACKGKSIKMPHTTMDAKGRMPTSLRRLLGPIHKRHLISRQN
jgi:hypothetical protein